MKRLVTVFAAISPLVFCFVAQPTAAHHSGAMFDYSKTVTLEGVVKEFAWTNPHVNLWMVTNPKDGQAAQTWFLQSTSPGNLTRVGWTRHNFKPGDRIKVELHPLRSGEHGGSFMRATLLDTGKEITVPTDYNAYGGTSKTE